jgi:hypothetical protein
VFKQEWVDRGRKKGALYMLIVHDIGKNIDYPIYCTSFAEFQGERRRKGERNIVDIIAL